MCASPARAISASGRGVRRALRVLVARVSVGLQKLCEILQGGETHLAVYDGRIALARLQNCRRYMLRDVQSVLGRICVQINYHGSNVFTVTGCRLVKGDGLRSLRPRWNWGNPVHLSLFLTL